MTWVLTTLFKVFHHVSFFTRLLLLTSHLQAQLRDYETSMEAALEHEKHTRIQEVEDLQAQLRQREVEPKTANSSLKREKEGRCTVEERLADAESKMTEQEQQIKELEDEAEGLYDDM